MAEPTGYLGYVDREGILRFRHDTTDHLEEMIESEEDGGVRYICPKGCDSFVIPRGIWKLPEPRKA
jgi:hypothetical protein